MKRIDFSRTWLFPNLAFLLVMVFWSRASVVAQHPVNLQTTVSIGGVSQWIRAKGADRSQPLLLYLHGGPGSSTMAYADRFMSRLYEHFIVVQWDQRGSGKTASISNQDSIVSVATFQRDTYQMIQYLLKQFGQNQLYLVSESWGNVLGMLTVRDHPEVVRAYVAISPMIDQAQSEQVGLALMQTKAREENHKQALQELSTISIPFRNGHELYLHRKWLAYFTKGTNGHKKSYPEGVYKQWAKTWLPVFNEASALNFASILPATAVPMYVFIGRNDQQVSARLVEEYFNQLKADRKQLIWFENSAHNITEAEPEKLQVELLETVLGLK